MDGRYSRRERGNEGRRQELKCLSGYMAKKVVRAAPSFTVVVLLTSIPERAGSMRVHYMDIYEFYSGIIFSQS
jgi:hypothetical protein